MFIFFHLMVGAILGLMLAEWRGDQRLFAAALAGSVLPDLIDKPLGKWILAGSIGYGRIYFHSLLFLILLIIAGFMLYRSRWGLPAMTLGAGVALHQAGDAMWQEPVNWLWPLLGPFTRGNSNENFLQYLLSDLNSPSEWLFLFTIGALVVAGLDSRTRAALPPTLAFLFRAFLVILPPILALAGIYAFLQAFHLAPFHLTGFNKSLDNILFGTGSLLAAAFLWIRKDRYIRIPEP